MTNLRWGMFRVRLTQLLRGLAPFIAQDWVVEGIVGLLFAWGLWSGFLLARASSGVAKHMKAAKDLFAKSPDATSFAARFETVSAELGRDAMLGASWNRFSHSLIVPSRPDRPVLATAEARQWFDLASLFRAAGADLRYHAALPGLLVGAGLLFTFLGLAAALSAAGGVVAEGVSQIERNAALRDLLGAASVKFVTSLAGLFLSIAYALFRKGQLKDAEIAFGDFLAALEDRLPFRSATALQADANALAERQYTEIQQISTDFFVNLGSTLERGFGAGLEQHLTPLASAIENLVNRMDNTNEDTLESMLDAFLTRMEGAVGKNSGNTAEILKSLGDRLDGLAAVMDTAAQRMSQSAREMAEGMGQGATSALGQIGAKMEDLLGQLRRLAEEQRQLGAHSGAELSATIARATDALQDSASRIAATLGGGAADASQRLVQATEAMRDDLHKVLEGFVTAIGDTGKAVTAGAVAGGEQLRAAAAGLVADLDATGRSLRKAGEDAGDALREGAADARSGMSQSVTELTRGSNELAARLAALGAAAAAIAERAQALEAATGSALAPLAGGASDLRAASVAALEAVRPLQEIGRSIAQATEGLKQTADALSGNQRQAEQLTARLIESAARFEPLDRHLSETLGTLGDNLHRYQSDIAAFFDRMDNGLKRSVEQLTAMATSLEDAVSDMTDALPVKGR